MKLRHCGRCGTPLNGVAHPCMLPTVWHLYDRDVPDLEAVAIGHILVFDVEGLCRGVVDEKLPAFQFFTGDPRPQPADYDEALGFLLGEVVVQVDRYVHAPGRELRPFLYNRLRFRIVDLWRRVYGRNGEKRADSLDRLVGTPDDGDSRASRLDLFVPNGAEDADRDRYPDLARALAINRRAAAREVGHLRVESDGPARARDPRAGRPGRVAA